MKNLVPVRDAAHAYRTPTVTQSIPFKRIVDGNVGRGNVQVGHVDGKET